MNSLVSSMSPNGNTNQAIGLAAWLDVAGRWRSVPHSAGDGSELQLQQVIILLTDGLNTQNRWSSTQSTIDTRQQLTCDNINAGKITLYTIQVNTGGDPTSTLLQNCAGSPGRSRLQQILPSDVGKPDHDRIHPDRHRTEPVARRQVKPTKIHRKAAPKTKARLTEPGFTLLPLTLMRRDSTKLTALRAPVITSPSPSGFRTACRFPWRDRHRARRSWKPWP